MIGLADLPVELFFYAIKRTLWGNFDCMRNYYNVDGK